MGGGGLEKPDSRDKNTNDETLGKDFFRPAKKQRTMLHHKNVIT